MDTIVALYENLSIAYYVLLNLKQGGCKAEDIGFVIEDKRQHPPKDRTFETRGITFDDDSLIQDLAELLPTVNAIHFSHKVDLVAAGPLHTMIKQTVDAALRVAVDPMPAALMAALIQLRLTDGEIDAFTEGVLDGKVLVLVNVDRSTRDRAVSITNAFLPIQINTPIRRRPQQHLEHNRAV